MEKKKILIYAHYYAPDVAATGQILSELAEGLTNDFSVSIICVVPSYSGKVAEKYQEKRFYKEECNGVELFRIRVPEFSKEKKISRVRNLVSYYIGARKATRILSKNSFDYVFTISQPPVMGGLLGVYGKKKMRAPNGKHPKLIYNIHDFNPEQTIAIGYVHNKLILKLMLIADVYSCRKSDLIITIGNDMIDTVFKRLKGKHVPKTVMINNWINEKDVFPLPYDTHQIVQFKKEHGIDNSFIIMYSGNIGLYYDLENLIQLTKDYRDAYTHDGRRVFFVFVGEGSILNRLKDFKDENKLDNVVFIPYQKKEDLIYSLNAADVHWCVNARGIKGVSVPSKIYGIMAVGKPVLGVMDKGSEARNVVEKAGCGLVCDPQDYCTVKKNIEWFISHAESSVLNNMGSCGRDYLNKNLSIRTSIKKYIDTINSL